MGQSRRFDRIPTTSARPLQTDIVTVRRHVSKVPIPAVASNGVVRLPRVTFLDTLRLVANPYFPRLKNEMDRAQEALRNDCPRSSSSAYTRRLE